VTPVPSVAVVIPTWDSLGLLPACLASLRDQDADLELMVVDNGSTDGTVAYMEQERVPHIALPRNIGFAPAVNLGVGRTKAPAVLVLNVDTELEPGCVGRLATRLATEAGTAGVQPLILQLEDSSSAPRPLDAASIYSAGQALTRDGRAVEEGAGEPHGPRYLEPHEVFGVCGAACLLRRELFAELGGYDERYFAFYEDVDLNVRARIAGWRFDYEPAAVVWHLGNASWQAGFQRPSAENARLVARNRLATQLKFMPLAALPRIALVEAGSLLRATRQKRFRASLRGKLEALGWLPALLRERRRLAATGGLEQVRRWLGPG
jgi:GT2 family glycosyltransferase